MSRIKASILGVVVSLLYAFMELTVVYALRVGAARGTGQRVLQICGLLTCYRGLIVETVADQQKYSAKRRALVTYGDPKFIGPTGGLYAITRHPNYTGEILFWLGLFVGGAVCFEGGMQSLGHSRRLDFGAFYRSCWAAPRGWKRSRRICMYGKQEKYEKWRQNVRWHDTLCVERELTIPGAKEI